MTPRERRLSSWLSSTTEAELEKAIQSLQAGDMLTEVRAELDRRKNAKAKAPAAPV